MTPEIRALPERSDPPHGGKVQTADCKPQSQECARVTYTLTSMASRRAASASSFAASANNASFICEFLFWKLEQTFYDFRMYFVKHVWKVESFKQMCWSGCGQGSGRLIGKLASGERLTRRKFAELKAVCRGTPRPHTKARDFERGSVNHFEQ